MLLSQDQSDLEARMSILTQRPKIWDSASLGTKIFFQVSVLVSRVWPRSRSLPSRRYASAGTSYDPVSVCLSVASRCFSKRDERINLVFGMEASFDQSYTVF